MATVTPLRIDLPRSPAARTALVDASREVLDAAREAAESATAAYTAMAPQIVRLRLSLVALRVAWASRHEDPTR